MSVPALPIARDAPWLAPLAGFSDLPFRLLCRENGAAAAVTEMVSAKGLLHHSPGTRDLLATAPGDLPLVVQLFGADAEVMARAMDTLLTRGFTHFDLNAGCPVPKVVKTGAGAAMLADPDNLAAVAGVMARMAGPGRAGVKLRLGVKPGQPVLPGLIPRLEQAGTAWLTVHPRFATQGFSGQADVSAFAALTGLTSVPMLYSGDLLSAAGAVDRLGRAGASGIMFARGALADPAVFSRFRNLLAGRPDPPATPARVAALAARYAVLAREHGNPHTALLKMRTVIPRFTRLLPGARALRKRLASCNSWEELGELIQAIAAQPGDATAPDKQ